MSGWDRVFGKYGLPLIAVLSGLTLITSLVLGEWSEAFDAAGMLGVAYIAIDYRRRWLALAEPLVERTVTRIRRLGERW